MDQQLQAITTLLALVNPVTCMAMFLRNTDAQSREEQLASATTVALTVLVILTLAALVGTDVLHAFGVSLDAFSVAGGGVLAWIGFSMLRGSLSGHAGAKPDSMDRQTSLGLFASSPGTITGVITLAATHSRLEIPVTALIATGVMWLATLLGIVLGSLRPGERIRTRCGDALHGAHRHRDGRSVRADWDPVVHERLIDRQR